MLETAKKLRYISGSKQLFVFSMNAADQHIQYVCRPQLRKVLKHISSLEAWVVPQSP